MFEFISRCVRAGAILIAMVGSPTAVLAHSKDKATMPSDGAVLKSAPDKIGMTFDRPMRITLITLRDASGGRHDLTRTDNMEPVIIFEAIPSDLPAGRFTIEWRGLSFDGHPMKGSFSFEIEG